MEDFSTIRKLTDLLEEAAAGQTREKYATKIGCSRPYLQKLLSGSAMPSRNLAIRIAETADGRIDENELFMAAGYPELISDGRKLVHGLSFEKWCRINFARLVSYANHVSGRVPFDPDQFLNDYRTKNSFSVFVAHFKEPQPYKNNASDAENLMPAVFVFYNIDTGDQQICNCSLYGHYSKGGKFYVTRMDVDEEYQIVKTSLPASGSLDDLPR